MGPGRGPRWVLALALLLSVALHPTRGEARMTQAAITRRPVPPNVTVRNARGFEADYTQTFDDSGRTYSRPGHISTSITWWRRIDPKTPQRIDRYYASPTYPASYVGWIDLKGETSHVDGSGTSGNDAKLMLTLEDLHGRWHSGKPLILVVGQRAQLDAAVVPVLNWIFSGNYYGMNLKVVFGVRPLRRAGVDQARVRSRDPRARGHTRAQRGDPPTTARSHVESTTRTRSAGGSSLTSCA
jgi:hypothetical protein